mgnify:CR=1 FL=1
MINRVLIVDTETTGLEPHSSQVIEIGAILYSVASGLALKPSMDRRFLNYGVPMAGPLNGSAPAMTLNGQSKLKWDKISSI